AWLLAGSRPPGRSPDQSIEERLPFPFRQFNLSSSEHARANLLLRRRVDEDVKRLQLPTPVGIPVPRKTRSRSSRASSGKSRDRNSVRFRKLSSMEYVSIAGTIVVR